MMLTGPGPIPPPPLPVGASSAMIAEDGLRWAQYQVASANHEKEAVRAARIASIIIFAGYASLIAVPVLFYLAG